LAVQKFLYQRFFPFMQILSSLWLYDYLWSKLMQPFGVDRCQAALERHVLLSSYIPFFQFTFSA